MKSLTKRIPDTNRQVATVGRSSLTGRSFGPTTRQRRASLRLVAFGVCALLLAASGTTLAADPGGGPKTFESRSASTQGDVSIQSFVCPGQVFSIKVNASTVGSKGTETCTGTVLVQQINLWLEWCDLDVFGVCFHWTTIRVYPSCARLGAGLLNCPAAGTYNASPGPGKYRTGLQSVVQDTSGPINTVSAWGPEVILTS